MFSAADSLRSLDVPDVPICRCQHAWMLGRLRLRDLMLREGGHQAGLIYLLLLLREFPGCEHYRKLPRALDLDQWARLLAAHSPPWTEEGTYHDPPGTPAPADALDRTDRVNIYALRHHAGQILYSEGDTWRDRENAAIRELVGDLLAFHLRPRKRRGWRPSNRKSPRGSRVSTG
jgi:hypothetical protein